MGLLFYASRRSVQHLDIDELKQELLSENAELGAKLPIFSFYDIKIGRMTLKKKTIYVL